MEIDLRKENDFVEYLSTETSSKYDVNKLDGVKNVSTVYLMNDNNSSLTKQSESELKTFFTENKNELIKILHEAIAINKDDYKKENEKIIHDVINSKFNEKYSSEFKSLNVVKFVKIVTELPSKENVNVGEIYGLNKNGKINYYIFLGNEFFAIMGKEEFENQYYKKEVLNSKLQEMNSKLNDAIQHLEIPNENLISKDDLNFYLEKINELNEKLSQILSQN